LRGTRRCGQLSQPPEHQSHFTHAYAFSWEVVLIRVD
jgi:hypothetical protein